ncbi:MAG TPA: MOSC N-terminal beta barrel domain-containing protein [Herpetosiphonaceae bacterium]
MRLAALYRYPIKSCKGFALDTAELDARGLADDRRLMVVDAAGRFLTQRELPRMALIEPRLAGAELTVRAPGAPDLTIACADDGPRLRVTIWGDQCLAADQGAEAARWFSAALGLDCRLVRIAPEETRLVTPDYAPRPTDQVGFADGFPLLLIGQESLDDLNRRLDHPLPMNRFRPNLVVAGAAPYAEDSWTRIEIGGIGFDLVKPCARCAITTTDQATAERGKEPLRTLAGYRRVGDKVMFGQNVVHDRAGSLRVGDEVRVLASDPARAISAGEA